jgi:hypothetical protein
MGRKTNGLATMAKHNYRDCGMFYLILTDLKDGHKEKGKIKNYEYTIEKMSGFLSQF